ncbi:LicD family protein [Nocardioides euryhalodurans]|uniref:LicD family protein n=1 Tax=Nocardioides euryhalodurans TaxID=2518370 RepID=UPI00141F813C|nr:LicD family protein [Nocardioides euryhalodurans]
MTLAEHRDILLGLLEDIRIHCEAEGLTYFLYAGTLIGALRHEGFIPWDDDLDVMMPRADYEVFCREFPRSGRVYLASGDTHGDFPYAYAKVCRSGTVVREPVAGGTDHFGVNVDVIPVDHVPAGRLAWRCHRALAMAVRAVLLAKVVEPTPDLARRTRVALRVARALLRPVPTAALTRARTRVATLRGGAATGHVGMLVASVPWRIAETDLAPAELVAFESVSAPVPRKAADLLEQIYGDFMTLPPEHQRVPPHSSTAYWVQGDPREGAR